MAAQLGDQRDHAGVDARHHPIGFFALVVPAEHPAGAAGQIGRVRAPPIRIRPRRARRRSHRFWRAATRALRPLISSANRGGRKCFLQLGEP
jgi:hypothetical protein